MSPTTEAGLSATELAERYGDAVWRVETDGCGYEGVGTAFAVGRRTLVTNAHVVADDPKPTVLSRDGATTVQTTVAGLDARLDVAVLASEQDLPGETLTWVDADDLAEGQSLVALGYPVPDHSFAVTPATVMSFQTEGSTRQALRLDGRVDKGNSGGPVMTGHGRVAGVVTGLLDSGYQWVAVAYTHDYLADAIRAFKRDRPGHVVSCNDVLPPPAVPDEWDWQDAPGWEVIGPQRYGDDPELDRLHDQCRDGDMVACDDLYWQSPYFSEYESFGASCGDTQAEPVWGYCTWYADAGLDEFEQADTFGDDPYLDELWTSCADGDLVACDDLYYEAPFGSDYEQFGADCGGHRAEPMAGMCSDSYDSE